ncbi:MAG TPA: Ig-like domain repeat protein [Terriglobales bacterium]|nr:Ig-like domain repeat protein [Terriglobales bacterium]
MLLPSYGLAQQAPQKLHKHVPSIVSSGQAGLLGRLPATQTVNMTIALPLRNQVGLTSLLGDLYNPASPSYRHFLSVEEFTDRFGPTAQDYESVVQWAKAQGFAITGTSKNRLIVDISGTAAQVNSAFNVSMNIYRDPNNKKRTFYSTDREPTLTLGVPVAHIEGLDNFSIPQPMLRLAKNAGSVANVTGSGPGGYYLGSDMRAAYYGGTLLTGVGQSVGLLEFGGYRLSDVNLTFNNAGQAYSVPINNVLIDGATPAAGSDDTEQVLDIAQAISMAPGLSQVRVYIGVNGHDADIFNSMATENICKQLSVSWSWAPDDPSSDDSIFQEFAAQGQSIFVASGDDGAYDAAISAYFYPAEDAYVTAVGGTNLTTNFGSGPWVAETAWNNSPYGSGGGISPDGIPIPSWQQGVATYSNGGSIYFRNVPDVAMEADLDNYYCAMGTCAGGVGGTSFAAPRWAGFMALINQQATEAGTAQSGGLGFINPTIYSIGEGSNYGADLHDITSGNNDSDNQPVWYSATTGYDLVTGWGSPNGASLINTLAGALVPGFWLAESPASISVAQGSSVTSSISLTDAGGFTGNVSLTASGLPTGVTASFNPITTAGTSLLTLTASSSATVGTSTVTLTGTSGSLSSKSSLFLTVNPPVVLPPSPGGIGSVNIGATSNSTTETLTFTTAGTLSTISVFTQGIANLDFANNGGGTCSVGTAYVANATCTVNVTFTPKYAGTRYGAVVLADASGNQLAKLYLEGNGVGPQATFNPGAQTSVGSGFLYPEVPAILGDGSFYVTDYGSGGNGALYFEKLSNGTYTQSNANCTLKSPVGVAVDGSGTIYVADPGVPAVYKVTLANGSCVETAIGSGFGTPWGTAVDGNGDVYIADLGTSTISAAVYKETLQVNGTYVQSTVGSGWVTPTAMAVDGNGNIDVADYGIPGVFMETPSGGSYAQSAIGTGWTAPSGIAIDGSGNIYVLEAGNSIVYGGTIPAAVYKEVPSGGTYTPTAIGSGWVAPRGIGLDASGNVYVADQTRGVFKNDLSDPPALAFANSVAGTISSDSPKTVMVSNIGTSALQFSALGYPSDFPEQAGNATDCTSSTSLGVGATCTLSIDFLPTTALGANTSLPLNESVSITTNTLNTTGTNQGVAVSGTEVLANGSVTLNVSSDPASVGTPITLTATVTGSTGGPTPTGSVSFYNGTTLLAGPLTLSSGVASYTTSSLTVGTYSISVSYSGDANYLAANSQTVTEIIVSAPGISNFGNTSIGTQHIGSTSNVIPLTITFSAAETLGSISVLTQGVSNLDFANAGGGTCSVGTAYAANASCTVNVTFTPKYSGTRYGAVVLADNNSNVIGTGFLEGTGTGPQIAFLPGTLSSIGSGFGFPQGVAVDGNSNLYVADASNVAVYKETLANGAYTQSTLGSGFGQPYGIAVDGVGNVYVADNGNHAVYKETLSNGAYTQTIVGYGFTSPMGVAVDALGDVYVADFGNGVTPGAVYLETLSNGSYTQSTIGSGFVTPQSVAVDGSGNVYVTDSANGNGDATVYKLMPSSGSYNQTTIGNGWVTPTGIAVDGNGNVYVTDDAYGLDDGFVVKEALQSDGSYSYYEQSTMLTSGSTPYPGGVAVDGRGNLFVTDNFDSVLYRDDLADPPALAFAATIFGFTSSDSPKTVSVENVGNASLTFSAVSYPADFPEAPGITIDCTSSTSLGSGTACALSIDFTPASLNSTNQSNLLSENVSVTTNSLNTSATAQAIAVSGTEAPPIATVALTLPANVATVGSSVIFTGTVTGPTGITAPTGSLTFYANGTALGTSALNNGAATYSTNSFAVGNYSITVSYSGDQIYGSATSNAVTETVIPVSTFGAQNIGSSNSSTFTITFAKRVTLGSISVVTQGTPNLDFTNAGGGTCTVGKAYAAGSICTVNVAFRPLYSGTRYGALALGDSKGNVIQTVYLEGTGIGPQAAFLPGSETVVDAGSTSDNVSSLAVDGNGNLYIANQASTISITKWTLSGGGYTLSTVPTSGLSSYLFAAVDGRGDIFISDTFNNRVVEETLSGTTYTQSTIGTGMHWPEGIAVDGSGDVFIVDYFNFRILKETLSSGSYIQSVLPTSALVGPIGVAVDGNGNVYIADQYYNPANGESIHRILKETPSGSGYTESTVVSGLGNANCVAVDGNENIYICDSNQIRKATWSSGSYVLGAVPTGSRIGSSSEEPGGVGIDGSGNVYIDDSGNNRILKEDFADPPRVSFDATPVGVTSTNGPKTVTVENVGNASLIFSNPSTGTNPSISPNFSLDSNSTSCPEVAASGTSAALGANSSCIYGVNFVPTVSGSISGSLVLTDNALNAIGGTQTILLSGTGNTQAQIAILTVGTGGSPQVTWMPVGTQPTNPVANGTWTDTYSQTFIAGVAEFVSGTCTEVGPGSLSVAKDLLGTRWSIATRSFALPNNQCPGQLYEFSTAYAEWGSDQADLQDPFTLDWKDVNGQLAETISSNTEYAHIAVTPATPSGSGQNPPLVATASLISPPSYAKGYTWTVIGGGGAIVFLNGQETMQSTTPSITVEEPNPTPGVKVPFKLSVKVATGSGTLQYGPIDDVFWNVPEVTVIGWVNGNAPDIISTINAGPSTPDLKTQLTGGFISCSNMLLNWLLLDRVDLNTTQDSAYASAWLLNNSGNSAPPPSISPSDQYAAGDYRLFNDFGSGKHLYGVGKTPFPCSHPVSWFDASAEPSPYMGSSGVVNSNTYQLSEGRVGLMGQIINYTINELSTPWVWSVIEFDANGNPSWSDRSMFPTYSVYVNGQLQPSSPIPQSAAQTFIDQTSTYQRLPSQVQ